VESLPKADKSITFHYRIVICDVLRPTGPKRHFLEKTTQTVSDFCVSNFKNGQKPNVFQLQRGFAPLIP